MQGSTNDFFIFPGNKDGILVSIFITDMFICFRNACRNITCLEYFKDKAYSMNKPLK